MIHLAHAGITPQAIIKLLSPSLTPGSQDCVPLCVDCVLAQVSCSPWRTSVYHGSLHQENVSNPGGKVSVDQLVSTQPGLIPQSSGWLTASHVWAGTVFVDNATNKIFTFLMTSNSYH